MYRLFKWPACLMFCLLWLNGAYAADVPSNPPSPSPPIHSQESATQTQDASPSAASQKAPVINVPEPSHYLGEVPEGIVINHDFKIKNTGEDVLRIERVRPG